MTSSLAGQAIAGRLPHIVLIMLDDMGYGDPGCYNADSKIKTPNMDAVAAAGMRFTDAHAAGPLCHMSRYGLLTGVYPFRTDVSRWPSQPLIAKDQMTLASMLKQRGYQTAMVGKWHLGFAEQGYEQPLPGGPCSVGFDSFFGIRASTDIPPYFYIRGDRAVEPPTMTIAANNSDGWSPIQGAFWRAGNIAPNMKLADVLPRFTDEAVAVIEDYQDQPESPLFLYLAYPAPHTPWLPSEEFVGKSDAGMYGDFTEMVDAMLGRVLRALEDAGLPEDTLLIVTSDNGPTWYETDVKRLGHDASGGWRGMKADAWEAGHRVPFVVRWPNVVPPGSTTNQLVSFVDVLATLAAVTDASTAPNMVHDSIDFSPVLGVDMTARQGHAAQLRNSLALQSGGGFMTFRYENWKLIEGLGSGGFSQPKKLEPQAGEPSVQLYNLHDDPAETTNLAQQFPERVSQLKTMLSRVLSTRPH
ncbi:MAG: arylsulfatase [Pirellulaceae bacterium]